MRILVTVAFLLVSLTGSLEQKLDALPLDSDKGGIGKVDAALGLIGMESGELVRDAKVMALGPLVNEKTIQPGAYVEFGNNLCTLNYVFRGGGHTYIGTAAHCVSFVGQVARDTDGDAFGTVAVIGSANVEDTDWALIRVNPAFYYKLSPAVRGHPDMPTGYTKASETSAGDAIQVSGYGMGFEFAGQTRENRYSVLLSDNSKTFELLPSTATPGDSGGPFLHLETGKALGIVSRGLPIGEDVGPTVEGLLPQMAAKGFPVTLATV